MQQHVNMGADDDTDVACKISKEASPTPGSQSDQPSQLPAPGLPIAKC
jgi:hypothetical protein